MAICAKSTDMLITHLLVSMQIFCDKRFRTNMYKFLWYIVYAYVLKEHNRNTMVITYYNCMPFIYSRLQIVGSFVKNT